MVLIDFLEGKFSTKTYYGHFLYVLYIPKRSHNRKITVVSKNCRDPF